MLAFHGPSYTIESQWGNFGTLLPPRGATFTPFWGMVLQSLPDTSNVANFTFLWNPLSELRGVKVFRNVKSMRFLGRYFAPGANIVPPIAYKSHSTPFPIRPHVLTPHSWLCDKNCGRSSAPKKSGRRIIRFDNNTNVALPYMAGTIKKSNVYPTHKLIYFNLFSHVYFF